MSETWVPVVGYEGKYEVSNLGRVRSLTRTHIHMGGLYTVRGRILKQSTRNGYRCVGLRSEGNQEVTDIHRIVAIAFIPNPYNKPEVNHKDFDRGNNQLDNLEWATKKENCEHTAKCGRSSRGTGRWSAKLDDKDVVEIRLRLQEGVSRTSLAQKYKVCRQTIDQIASRKTWRHV